MGINSEENTTSMDPTGDFGLHSPKSHGRTMANLVGTIAFRTAYLFVAASRTYLGGGIDVSVIVARLKVPVLNGRILKA